MNSKDIIPKNDQYLNVYGDKYIQKIDFLIDLLINKESGVNAYNVLNFEAGFGKSYYSDVIINNYLEVTWENRRKFLIVKKFNDESEKSAATISKGLIFTHDVAVVTSDSWNNKWKHCTDELVQHPVIIISHKRYIDLCLNEKERVIFQQDRHSLIIDEKVNFPIHTYTDQFYSNARAVIASYNREAIFDKACKSLNDEIDKYKHTNSIMKIKPSVNKKVFSEFEKMMKAEISNGNLKHKRILSEFLQTVKQCYDNNVQATINNGRICTFNLKYQHWGLKNNIILDASANIDGVYHLNQKFNLIRQTPMIDHSSSKYIHIKTSSSKSFIQQNKAEYFKRMIDFMEERNSHTERTLIVVHKKYAEYLYDEMNLRFNGNVWVEQLDKNKYHPQYNNESYVIAWFGNLIGKNLYGGFDNVWILGTPNLPLNNYLVHFMQYANESLGRRSLSVMNNGRLKNPAYNAVQEGYIASEMYQSMKRIQRNTNPKGKFYIVHNDEKIVKEAISPMKNAEITEVIDIEFDNKKSEKKETINDKAADYIFSLYKEGQHKEKIQKAEIAEHFGKRLKWDRIKQKPIMQELMVKGQLREQQRYFIIFKKVDKAS